MTKLNLINETELKYGKLVYEDTFNDYEDSQLVDELNYFCIKNFSLNINDKIEEEIKKELITDDPVKKIRNQYILWKLFQNYEDIQKCISDLFKLITESIELDITTLTNSIINFYVLSHKYDLKKQESTRILLNYYNQSKFFKKENIYFYDTIFEFTRIDHDLTNEEKRNIEIIYWDYYCNILKKSDSILDYQIISYLENGLKTSEHRKYEEALGDTYLVMINDEEPGMKRNIHYNKALHYLNLSNKEKCKQIYKKYLEDKSVDKNSMASFQSKFTIEDSFIKGFVKNIDSTGFFNFLSYDNLIPKPEKVTDPLLRDSTFLVYNDKFNSRKIEIDNEYATYSILLRKLAIYINLLMKEYSTKNIITFNEMEKYLESNYEIFNNDFYIDGFEIKWNEMLYPIFQEYFRQLNLDDEQVNFMLCIDSLSLKMEGLIKKICEVNGMILTTFNEEKQEVVEKSLDSILNSKDAEEIFEEKELYFFKFLLLKNGYNLRNEVAHTLIFPDQYTEIYMTLLIITFFRLIPYIN